MRENGMEGERGNSSQEICFYPCFFCFYPCPWKRVPGWDEQELAVLGWLGQWPGLPWQQGQGLHYPEPLSAGVQSNGCDKTGVWQVASAGHPWLPSWAPSQPWWQGRAQLRVVLLTRLTVKEKLEKAFLGICLDGLLFLEVCTVWSNYYLRERKLCCLCSLKQKSITFGDFCVSCRAEITELLPLLPLCQGCFQTKSEFTARRVLLREGSCPGLTWTCYLFTKQLNVHEWNCKSEKLGCPQISCSCHWGKWHTALFQAGEWKGKGLGRAALSEICGAWLGTIPASPWAGYPWTTTVLPQSLPHFNFYFTSVCL